MTRQRRISRRRFLGTSLAATGAAAFPAIIPATALGMNNRAAPSERVVIGAIGVGDRGAHLLGETLQSPGAQVVAVCDVKRDRLETAAQTVNRHYENQGCAAYNDHELLTARGDIDAVIVASCDHWHVLHALAAVRTGKGVYLEKPMGVTVQEDQALREAVHKHNAVFQFGTQQRSDKKFRQACELVRNGYIGKLHTIYVWAPPSVAGGPTEQAPVPETLDYDRWLGPAPFTPYTLERESNKWWWHISDYAVGFIAGWGIHPVDIAFWGAGELLSAPCWIDGVGRFPTEGVCNCATDWKITCAYDSGVTVEYRAEPAPVDWQRRFRADAGHGTAFVGDEGWVCVNRREITSEPESLAAMTLPDSAQRLYESRHHVRNFVECVREKRDTVSPIDESVAGDLFCHACDIAIRAARPLRFDPRREVFPDDAAANQRLSRPMRAPWKLA